MRAASDGGNDRDLDVAMPDREIRDRASVGRSPPGIRPRRTLAGRSGARKYPLHESVPRDTAPADRLAGPAASLLELDPFVPVRDEGREAQGPDLRFEHDLRLGIAVDEEHPAREAGVTRTPAAREPLEPVE
jgi:hypothetical protein